MNKEISSSHFLHKFILQLCVLYRQKPLILFVLFKVFVFSIPSVFRLVEEEHTIFLLLLLISLQLLLFQLPNSTCTSFSLVFPSPLLHPDADVMLVWQDGNFNFFNGFSHLGVQQPLHLNGLDLKCGRR